MDCVLVGPAVLRREGTYQQHVNTLQQVALETGPFVIPGRAQALEKGYPRDRCDTPLTEFRAILTKKLLPDRTCCFGPTIVRGDESGHIQSTRVDWKAEIATDEHGCTIRVSFYLTR